MSHSSWPRTNILLGRCPFYLLLYQPRGLVGCTAFAFVFVARIVGDFVPSRFFLTLCLRPRILPFLTRFGEFSVSSLCDFVGGDRDELLLCPIRAPWKHLTRTEQYHLAIEGLFIPMGWSKKQMSWNTISFWLRSVITLAHASTSEPVKSRKVATSLLFKRHCSVHQVLKAGTWSAQSTLSPFYLRDVINRHLDTFSIGPLMAAQQVV